jgi:hypothetical protein
MGIALPVKWYDSTQNPGVTPGGASAGMMAAWLDAILVDGFNLRTLDSLTVTSGVATATRSTGHPFVPYQVIEISGATPSTLNGQWRVTAVTGTTFTFTATGVADAVASGTITCKAPGLGWERVFTGTNKRVYRSQDTSECARSYFRVDDTFTDTYGARLRCFASMSDIDTGTGEWTGHTSFNALSRSNATNWFAVGDGKTLYWVVYGAEGNLWLANGFGAFKSFLPADADNDFAMTKISAYDELKTGSTFNQHYGYSSNFAWTFTLRNNALRTGKTNGTGLRWQNVKSGYGGPVFPEPFTSGLLVTPSLIREVGHSGDPIRGLARGQYWVLHDRPMSCDAPGVNLDDVVGLDGRRCRLIRYQEYYLGVWYGDEARMCVDITGPWE